VGVLYLSNKILDKYKIKLARYLDNYKYSDKIVPCDFKGGKIHGTGYAADEAARQMRTCDSSSALLESITKSYTDAFKSTWGNEPENLNGTYAYPFRKYE